jgi:hypothetical protein
MPNYTNIKMVGNKNFILRLLSSSLKYMGNKIFHVLEEKYKKEKYVIPLYWIILLKLYNICKKTILMHKLS